MITREYLIRNEAELMKTTLYSDGEIQLAKDDLDKRLNCEEWQLENDTIKIALMAIHTLQAYRRSLKDLLNIQGGK